MITIDADPRMQQGAYITDGIDLYEVTGSLRGPGVMGISTVRLRVENCQSMESLELLPDKVRGQFKLVREAPSGICPGRRGADLVGTGDGRLGALDHRYPAGIRIPRP